MVFVLLLLAGIFSLFYENTNNYAIGYLIKMSGLVTKE